MFVTHVETAMPTLRRFIIKNFRGIKSAEINVDVRKNANVITLIGLNESGKTTILEALSHFSTGDRTIPNLVARSERKEHLISLIPIDRRAAFTDSIKITAEIGFPEGEFQKYVDRAKLRFSKDLRVKSPIEKISVAKCFEYKDSSYVRQMSYWSGIDLEVKDAGKKKYVDYVSPEDKTVDNDVWLWIVEEIEKELFELVYFPTFIVDMPNRIYLEEHDNESAINLYYRKVIEDILASLDEGIDLKRHVVQRLKDAKRLDATPNWFSIFFGKPERSLVDSVLNKIQAAINREVIGSWAKVFKGSATSRSVKLEWNVDSQKQDMAYLSFAISDGQSTYAIHERSLGFRWFFSYLLFTQFRSKSKKKTIFLFDEPAANLHAKAQSQLMESIARIVGGGNKAIYSTHSPHMINPAWLSDAFIVENKSVNIEKHEDIYGMEMKANDIHAVGYGEFVSKFPEKTTYFQPVWEKLLYEIPPIVGSGPYLCVEGISDFHLFYYVRNLNDQKFKFSIVPGVGAGGFEATLPSLYGIGAQFILLLDDDTQGRKEKVRYIEKGILSEDQVYTLADVNPEFAGRRLEELITAGSMSLIKGRFSGKSGKKQVGMYLAEIASSGAKGSLDTETIANGEIVLHWFADKISK
ncbi:AAA family ATPase [Rhizobium rhizophilum]|uniref:Endonuclease GajA/Old nuclease/RecF-like AAA domain-containing protein n=1 Tax=Rhizobium rhizophilum TaxID=1850373 RepID=A0ABY2QP27_9HYPH|nr:AAA family ATPase [Rhizobium rhizophilum]THV11094.1 hypothetical protein E9677_22340 [Rhizobium rhizophilum]